MTLVATQVKRRRGTNDENDAFAGAEGEITVDLTNKELRVHDGSGSTGGFRIGRQSDRTNCIIKSQQDIILELNNGALTLKSGSKLYQPNGSGTFTPITIGSDRTRNDFSGWGSGTYVVFYSPSYASGGGSGIIATGINRSVSGATDPLSTTGRVWYDTTNNKIKIYENSSYTRDDLTFPIAIVDLVNGTGVTKIVEIFNGRGVMGRSAFLLPNADFLIADKRNLDGTPKNILVHKTMIAVYNLQSLSAGHTYDVCVSSGGGIAFFYTPIEYNSIQNQNYAGGVATAWAKIGTVSFDSNGAIKTIKLFQPFCGVGYDDTEYMAHQAKPSAKNITNLLPTSITTQQDITAPADGFIGIHGQMSSGNACTIYILNSARVATIGSPTSAIYGGAFFAVQKGAIIRLLLSGGTFDQIDSYFVYAQGAK